MMERDFKPANVEVPPESSRIKGTINGPLVPCAAQLPDCATSDLTCCSSLHFDSTLTRLNSSYSTRYTISFSNSPFTQR